MSVLEVAEASRPACQQGPDLTPYFLLAAAHWLTLSLRFRFRWQRSVSLDLVLGNTALDESAIGLVALPA